LGALGSPLRLLLERVSVFGGLVLRLLQSALRLAAWRIEWARRSIAIPAVARSIECTLASLLNVARLGLTRRLLNLPRLPLDR
jgi:hypothetical protein